MEPLLQRPDFSQPCILTTDASGFAKGGILSQGKIGKDMCKLLVSHMTHMRKKLLL